MQNFDPYAPRQQSPYLFQPYQRRPQQQDQDPQQLIQALEVYGQQPQNIQMPKTQDGGSLLDLLGGGGGLMGLFG